jgi:hypothetical protein
VVSGDDAGADRAVPAVEPSATDRLLALTIEERAAVICRARADAIAARRCALYSLRLPRW